MEVGWSARRVARQLGRSDCVVKRCWNQWIREMSFTRRPGSERPRQTSRQEDPHIDKPEDLTRKDEMDWITKNSDAIAYIKLSLADEQALQFAAEDNVKVLWDKIRATYMGEGEDRKIDAGNELKNIRMKKWRNCSRLYCKSAGISTKCHSLGLDVSPRELVYHTVRGLNGKFSKVRDILKTQRGKSMDEILQILREEEATLNLPIKTRMDGINEAFYLQAKETILLEMDTYLQLPIEKEKPCDNIWILDSGASCHMAKEPVWFKNISPKVMDIYLADKNSKMMSQGTGNVSAKTTTSSPRTGRIQIPVLELNDVRNQILVRRSERLKSKLMSVHLVNNVPNCYFEAENSAN
ncbi:retrovirus-related Pol polyprotein from transposon TNT 1-94 [Trichonephila clavipes]|nr:retrovirus-related Pol polyprotein from transposon TNT 1-94 [Trichonephila clavipes]